MQRRPTLKPDGRKVTLIVLYIPSVERDGHTPVSQDAWVQKALDFFGSVFGGATAFPKANAAMAKPKLDFDELARGLGAERKGQIKASPGYFGAAQLATELAHRLRVPANGGRPTDPTWTERRIVPLRRSTLDRLNADADRLGIEPMQLAALLIEKGLDSQEGLDSVGKTPSGPAPMRRTQRR